MAHRSITDYQKPVVMLLRNISVGRELHSLTTMGERNASGDVSARFAFQFIRDSPLFLSEKPYSVVRTKELPDDESTNIVYDECDVTDMLQDIRGREADFTLDKNSVCWLHHPSKIDITTEEDTMIPYAKEVNSLLRKTFKSEDVICYDLRVSPSMAMRHGI
jgi:hypothetical protein